MEEGSCIDRCRIPGPAVQGDAGPSWALSLLFLNNVKLFGLQTIQIMERHSLALRDNTYTESCVSTVETSKTRKKTSKPRFGNVRHVCMGFVSGDYVQ